MSLVAQIFKVLRHYFQTRRQTGVVVNLNVKEGQYLKTGDALFGIADLTSVWLKMEAYESDLPWIREDLPAVVSFRHDPGQVYNGGVLFLYPEVSRDTRTLKVCVEIPNSERLLRPGMYADVVIQGPPIDKAVVIPQSSIIRSGERNIVFVDIGEGKFQPREVQLGVKGEGDDIQVLEGVGPGELVVTQAQFMLDSESRIQEAIAKFMERGLGKSSSPEPASGHEH